MQGQWGSDTFRSLGMPRFLTAPAVSELANEELWQHGAHGTLSWSSLWLSVLVLLSRMLPRVSHPKALAQPACPAGAVLTVSSTRGFRRICKSSPTLDVLSSS